jgi:tetratricopeptide (TPR) repeat protein
MLQAPAPLPQAKPEAARQRLAMLQQEEAGKRLQACKDLVLAGTNHLGGDKPVTVKQQAIIELKQAVTACDSAATNGRRAIAHNNLAVAYALVKQWEDARKHFYRAIELSKSFPRGEQEVPYMGLAYVGTERNAGLVRNAEALTSLAKIDELRGKSPETHSGTGPIPLWHYLADPKFLEGQ